ncbi:MAG TPA: hypothetical protein VJ596_10315 [Gemmatimonadaceae bacterium]|nr:hypothetical protein [Gemmatimonadaceae bacterium]
MSLHSAIDSYHELLTPELAAHTQGQLNEELARRGLFFGHRPLCTVLRPRFLSPRQYAFLRDRGRRVLGAFEKAYRAAMADPSVRAQFHLLPWEEEMLATDPGFREPSPTSRLDAFFEGEDHGLWFTEYNAETPAGVAYGDMLAEVFLALPITGEFLRKFELRPLPARHTVLHVLLDAYRQWSHSRELPRICILDWREVPTYSEFVLFAEYFRSHGLECVIADPREVEYRRGQLVAGDRHITLVYKRVLISELVAHGGLEHPVVRAVRDRAVCMVNPFRCKVLHKKTSLAVLSDERNASLFTSEEQQAIDDHIPWTRTVEERRTVHGGKAVDLIAFAQEHREQLVLKPSDEYGGKGIVLGWEADPSAWDATLQTALTDPYILQQRVTLPSEPYPSLVDGTVQLADRMLDTAPFVSYGRYVDGCMTRLSTAALLNVTAGGGSTVPTFLVDRR